MEMAIKVDAEEKSFCWDDGILERGEDGKICRRPTRHLINLLFTALLGPLCAWHRDVMS